MKQETVPETFSPALSQPKPDEANCSASAPSGLASAELADEELAGIAGGRSIKPRAQLA